MSTTALYIPTLSVEYSDNLLALNSTFNNDLVWNITNGTGVVTHDDSVFFQGKSIKIESLDNTLLSFNTITNLGFTAQNTGTYIFSFRVMCKVSTGDDPGVFINIFKNGVPFVELQAFVTEAPLNNWNCFAQSFSLNDGDIITYSLSYQSGTTDSNIVWLDGLKCEFDDRNLGIPTAYSMPISYCCGEIDNLIFVDSFEKLPTPIAGVINLESEKTYYLTSNIDLLGNRLVCGENTTILGTSSENASISSTGLGIGIPLITSIYTNPIRNISIKDVDTAFNFDGTTNPSDMALDWTGINFVNVPNVGLIKKASNFIFDKGAFLNSKGLKFDGTIGTIALNNSLFTGDGLTGNIIEVLSTCTITRRFRVTYSSLVASSLTKGISFNTSAVVPVESYILDTVNFSGGGTYLDGVTVSDNKTLFVNCKGISNTAEVSSYYMNGNTTTTVISGVSTPTKVLGTTTSSAITQKFTNTNNRATYNGSLTRLFSVISTLSVESGNNNQIGCYIAKNGVVLNDSEVYGTTTGAGRAENIVIQTLVELSTNDYIECFVENGTSITNVLVTNLNTTIK